MTKEAAEAVVFAALAELDAPNKPVAGVVAGWRPRDEDWARLFVGDAAARAQAGYEGLWAKPPVVTEKGMHRLWLAGANAEHFRTQAPEALAWPGGYLEVAAQLADGPWWWQFRLAPLIGEGGETWDGLVALDDRVVWCPKPWKVLR